MKNKAKTALAFGVPELRVDVCEYVRVRHGRIEWVRSHTRRWPEKRL